MLNKPTRSNFTQSLNKADFCDNNDVRNSLFWDILEIDKSFSALTIHDQFLRMLIFYFSQAGYEMLYSQYLEREETTREQGGDQNTVEVMQAILNVNNTKKSCLIMWKNPLSYFRK